jgi:putative DNA primase/helicase
VIGTDYDDDGRLIVSAGNRNPVDVADDVAAHLLKNNEPPQLFSMNPAAVLLKDEGNLVPLDADGWLAYVARRVTFTVPTRDGTGRIVPPPAAVMKMIPAVVIPELPPLDGVATTPYLDGDGTLVASDGYHPGTRLVLHVGGLSLPSISETPSAGEVKAAVELLSTEWLGDFPFAGPADKANAIAALLTLTGRPFFSLAPLFVADASTPGSGKGLFVTTLTLVATGEPPHFLELPADGEEQRKKVTSALLAGHALIAWDESHVIAGRTLAMILTAEKYSDRLLGGNKMLTVTNRFTQIALGNNVQVWGDMKRRVVPCRMVPDTGRPEQRTDFRHPDLEHWVRVNRSELLTAALTIWRNWVAKGRPKADVTMGSFDRWARTVGGALKAAGVPGFLSHTDQWLDNSDQDASEWQEHLADLHATYGETQFTALDVAQLAGNGRMTLPWFKRDADMPFAKALGYRYRAIRDRWLGDLRLVSPGMTNGRARWQVQTRTGPARIETSEIMPTHPTISTQNHDKPDTPSRDGDISRHPNRGSDSNECRCAACGKPPRRGCSTCWEHAYLEGTA